MKFAQLIEYNKRNIFFQKSCIKESKDQFQSSFCFLRKLYMRQKQVVGYSVSMYFESPQLDLQEKQTVDFKTLDH